MTTMIEQMVVEEMTFCEGNSCCLQMAMDEEGGFNGGGGAASPSSPSSRFPPAAAAAGVVLGPQQHAAGGPLPLAGGGGGATAKDVPILTDLVRATGEGAAASASALSTMPIIPHDAGGDASGTINIAFAWMGWMEKYNSREIIHCSPYY